MQRFLLKSDLSIIKNTFMRSILFIIFCSNFISAESFANNSNGTLYSFNPLIAHGSLQGKITSAGDNGTLIGVTVFIKLIGLGTTTDIEGQYIIDNIPAGTYDVSITYIGYETAIVPVTISAGQPTTLNYELKSSSTQLDEVVIVGDKALSGKVVETNELSMLKDIRVSALNITGISSQQISRSVDNDAGEVAKRLPGVTILSNFINIRGMHERYNLTILNGMVAPSSEADRRAFSYDLLPSNMIDKMTVYRSPAPELLADWAGGVIKIETKNSSIAREIEVNMSTSFRSNSTFKDYYTYDGGKKDWMGMDDGTRALPDGFPELGAIPAGGLTDRSHFRPDPSTFTAEELAANASLGSSLYNKWNLKKESSGLDYRAGINYYDSRRFGKMRLSNLTSINTTQSKLIRYQDFNPSLSEKNGETNNTRGLKISYRDTISQQVSRWGLLQNLSLTITPKHVVQLNGLLNQLGIDEIYLRNGIDANAEVNNIVTKYIYTYRSRTLFGLQASGKHSFGKADSNNLSWTAAYNSSKEEIPAQRQLSFSPLSRIASEESPRYLLESSFGRITFNNRLFYASTKEENSILSIDYERKLFLGSAIKIGIFHEDKYKPLLSRLVQINGVDQLLYNDGDTTLIDPFHAEDAFKDSNFKTDGKGLYITDDAEVSGQFLAKGKIYAAYTAVNIPLLKDRLKIYGGVRYEGQHLSLTIPPSEYLIKSLGKKAELINQYVYYWLPSVNASMNFTPKITLRASYGKTINRPNYRELIPILLIEPRLQNIRVGNDSLKDAQIHNFDIRLEYYPTSTEFISVGAYYKKLTNAIEPYVIEEGNTERILYSNTKGAAVLGLEAEVRKSFNFLPWKWAQGLSTIANFALLKSQITLADGLVRENTGNFRESQSSERPLEGTPNFIVNTGLYYDHEKWGTKVSVIYNITGQRLIVAGSVQFPDTYEMPRHSIDLTLRQPLTKFMELRAGVQDVLNQARRTYRDYDRDQRYDPNKRNKLPINDWMFQQFKPGRYFTLGINIKI